MPERQGQASTSGSAVRAGATRPRQLTAAPLLRWQKMVAAVCIARARATVPQGESLTLDATCYYVTAPMFAETKQLRDALVSSEPVRSVLDMARRVDMALLSAVDLSAQSKALEYDVISRRLWQSLRDAGAVGDVCSHYLDIDGKPIAHPIAARMINPTLDDLRNVPELILAAGGRQKVSIIRGAILARLCHVLVTDEIAASA